MTEYSLHSDIKGYYSVLDNEVEVKVDNGFVVDVLRDGLVIEVQTCNFSAIRNKLRNLVENRRVRLVYPIARRKWLVYVTKFGEVVKKRRSPKKAKLVEIFYELAHLCELIKCKNFSFEVLFVEEEEVRCDDGKGSWRRRGMSVKDRRLLNVFDSVIFRGRHDFLRFLPFDRGEYFSNKLLAKKLGLPVRLAQKITYCLRKMDVLSVVGKREKEYLFCCQLRIE